METTMYDTLLQLPLFQGICQSDFTNIIGKVKFHFSRHKAGEKIVSKGDNCTNLIFLLKGELMSEATNKENSYTYCELYNAPNVIEPYSLFGMNTQYMASYVTQTDANLVTISKNFVMSELNKYDIFRLNYLNIISNRSQVLYDRLWNLTSEDTDAKIINFLISHSEKLNGQKILKIKMDDFAKILGDTRLTISKALNEMQEKELVVLHRKEIEIPELENLVSYKKSV